MQPMPSTTDDTAAARDPRTSVMLSADVVRSEGSQPTQHRVLNVSVSGVCIAKPVGLVADMPVMVSIGRVDHVAARVKWVRGDRAGLRFDARIDLDAARQRRVGNAAPPPSSGWMASANERFRRQITA
ncbi:PilZ domain-containing protein [Sphingomonas palmae]|uniref:PilZ domain-containing protein n=1 Tax=Sphingomonas palmae TaxID=1855283 RepID=A0A1H7MGA4_9SPHN|nr:PilZ domain-containing protein [Sphingomonas palmae]SEL09657.1 PilZ domain-containing protein [Sphingomonas palmae]